MLIGLLLCVLGAALSAASMSFDDWRLLVAAAVVGGLGILAVYGGA